MRKPKSVSQVGNWFHFGKAVRILRFFGGWWRGPRGTVPYWEPWAGVRVEKLLSLRYCFVLVAVCASLALNVITE